MGVIIGVIPSLADTSTATYMYQPYTVYSFYIVYNQRLCSNANMGLFVELFLTLSTLYNLMFQTVCRMLDIIRTDITHVCEPFTDTVIY